MFLTASILKQTLHLIYDMKATMRTLYRTLKPGGVLLATVPGISQLERGRWKETWYWSLTILSTRRLAEEAFPGENVEVGSHGNVLATTAFLMGLAAEELEAILLAPRELPRALRLEIGGQIHEWAPIEAARDFLKQSRSHQTQGGLEGQPNSRHALYFSVWEKLKPLSPLARAKVLDDIRTWAGNFSGLRDSHRPLTEDELRALDGSTVELGAHTVSHPSLAKHSPDVQKQEIRESKRWLEDFLGTSVRAFAYPYGDHSCATAALVAQAGFELACTTQATAVLGRNNPYTLPRIAISDWDRTEFASCLVESFARETIG
jgi:Polysaccharide deacetylase